MRAYTWICSAASPIRLQLLNHTGSHLLKNNNIHKDCAIYNAASQPHWFHAYLRITTLINVEQLLYNFLDQIVQHRVLLEGDAILCHLCSRYQTCFAFFLAPTLPVSTVNGQLACKSQQGSCHAIVWAVRKCDIVPLHVDGF